MARILVIEDDVASLELIRYLLEAFGHTVLTADNGLEGVEIAHQERLDLILCDIRLPKMDGFEVARQLKSHRMLRTIPLVAVTAYAMVGDRDKMLKAGFDEYLPKPIVPETFVKQVEGFLRSGQPGGSVKSRQDQGNGDLPSPRSSSRCATLFYRGLEKDGDILSKTFAEYLSLDSSSAKSVYQVVREFIGARTVRPQIHRSWRVQWQPS